MQNAVRLSAVCVAALLAVRPVPAAATCTLGKVTTLPLTTIGRHIYVPVSINETQGLFMVDTGSEYTILTGAFAALAHVGMDARAGQKTLTGVGDRQTLPVNQAHVRRTDVGTLSFPDWEYIVLPDEDGGIGKTERDGILGMDFMHYFDIDLDFQAKTLTFWRLIGCTNIHPEWQGDYDAIPLKHTAHQSVTMPIVVDNAIFDVEFDTGSPTLLLTHDAGLKAGVTDAALANDRDPGGHGLGGHFPAVLHHFQMLLVGSQQVKSPAVLVETENHRTPYADGLLGLRYLSPRKVWISYTTSTLFVQPGGK